MIKKIHKFSIIKTKYYKIFLYILSVTFIFISGCRFRNTTNNTSAVINSTDTLKSVSFPVIIAEYGVIAVPYNVVRQDSDLLTEPETEQEELYEKRD
jgi:ABC-type sulfate transport system permease subunit